MQISSKAMGAWDNSEECNCNVQDCEQNHKKCYICNGYIVYTAYQSNQDSKNSWNIDHVVRARDGGSNSGSNLKAVHVSCNSKKN